MIRKIFSVGAVILCIMSQSCSRLSSEAKEIAGCYVIPEISQQQPVMQLNKDATCVIRAIKPGVLTYSVNGTWNVKNDSLIMFLDPSSLMVEEGDSTLVGYVPENVSRKVEGYTDLSLELKNDDVVYFYKKIEL